MKKGIFLIILVSIGTIYIYTKKEPQKAITVTVKKKKTEPLPSEQNTTVVKEVKTKKPIVHKPSKSNKQNETNKTASPKMCLVGVEKSYRYFENYTFDKFGHIKTITTDKNQDGKTESKTFLSYDERGNLIKSVTKIYQEEMTKTPDAIENYPDKDYQDIPPEIVTTKTMSYDENNHLIDKIIESNSMTFQYHYDYDEQGNINHELVYVNDELYYDVQVINLYDKQNHLLSVKHKFIQSNPKLLFTNGEFSNYEYKYNKKGQLIKKIDPSYYRVFEYSYDELGHLVKEESYRNRINQPDKIIRHLDTIYYKYDTYGNLVEKSNSNGEILLKQKFEVCK